MFNLASFFVLGFATVAVADKGYCAVGECPWVVTVRTELAHVTGGSILNEYWILTAARGLIDRDPKQLRVVAGIVQHDGNNNKDFTYMVESFITHEAYGLIVEAKHLRHDDIALIRLTAPIAFNRIIKPIALPVSDVTEYGGQAYVVGWTKALILGGDRVLMDIVSLESPSSCQTEPMYVTDHRHICRRKKNPSNIVDYGGPMVHEGVQVGIQSYDPNNYSKSAVFTRVWHYMEWIKNKITENSTSQSPPSSTVPPTTVSPTTVPPTTVPPTTVRPTTVPPTTVPPTTVRPTTVPPTTVPPPTVPPTTVPPPTVPPTTIPPSSPPPSQPSGNLGFQFNLSIFMNGSISLPNKS